jgi:hypothetical protein
MPALNGIEAAKRICRDCPHSRIIFVTQENDVDIRVAAPRRRRGRLSTQGKCTERTFTRGRCSSTGWSRRPRTPSRLRPRILVLELP